MFPTSPDLSAHSDLQPHQHLSGVAPAVGLRGPQPEQSEVVFLNVTSVKSVQPVEAVLPPLIPPPVSSLLPSLQKSLLPDGLYQPGPLDYDDYDNAIDDGNSHSSHSFLILTLFFLSIFVSCLIFS